VASPFAPKLTAVLALGATCAAIAAAAAPAQAASPPRTQRLVILKQAHHAYSKPDHRSRALTSVARRRPITLARTTLPVLGERTGPDRRDWLHVMLPGRPNGHTGWISRNATIAAVTAWRIEADISLRRVTVFHSGHLTRTYRAVVGKPSTPTPHGRFFVEETVRLSGSMVGAPYALALSARSNVLEQFDGGPGQIALHGLGNVGGVPGTAASHGCLRLDNRSITWLAARIGPGVPVTIRR
jgi:lipoprotein-anchoring transpeptidase ErfK/SrfK